MTREQEGTCGETWSLSNVSLFPVLLLGFEAV